MISATALLYESPKTLSMLKRHKDEGRLGVQITGRTADDVGRAVAILDRMPFDTVDINMGCPVRKVVKTGCGSAILKDPERVYHTVKAARESTAKPLSAKIRIGWDRQSVNAIEVAQACEAAGADWVVVHGRTRADDYSVPVDLENIAALKRAVGVPVIGNGNLFSHQDAAYMLAKTGVDGLMVSRGALGHPWIFRDIKYGEQSLHRNEWRQTVLDHLAWQQEEYGDRGAGAVCMRKHLLWYAKGWPGAKELRERLNQSDSLASAADLIEQFYESLIGREWDFRRSSTKDDQDSRFHWDPKWDMDRRLDRGVGDDGLVQPALPVS
jgi:tRNA-dihydrouridine synthase B